MSYIIYRKYNNGKWQMIDRASTEARAIANAQFQERQWADSPNPPQFKACYNGFKSITVYGGKP